MSLKSLCILLSGLLLLSPVSMTEAIDFDRIELPDMGDSSGTIITPEEEKELGEAFFRSLHSQITITQDPEISDFIQAIGKKLVTNSDAPAQPFHFFVVMANDINAFAGPGGYIGVNSGLILNTEAESELASVMAHEIAHVTQRHLYRAAEAAGRLSIPTAAATLAAILLGTQAPALGQAALVAIQAGSIQFQINFTRENEEEADRVGMQTLSRSEFDPRSMPVFFERLQQSTRYYGQNIPEFLRTHPVTASRISDTRGRAENYPYKQYPDSITYQIARAKLRVLSESDVSKAKTYFQARLNQGTLEQRTVAKYGLGLVALKAQQYKEAETIFRQLTSEFPSQPHYAAAYANTALDAGNYATALERFKKATKDFPNREAVKLQYISALLKSDKAEIAKNQLLSLTSETRNSPLYYELLAQSYGALKQPAESHRYLAEYYYSIGMTRDAILQIRLAQKSEGVDFRLASILNERLSFFISREKQARENQ